MRSAWIVAAALAVAGCGQQDGGPGPVQDPRRWPAGLDADGDGVPVSVDCNDADPSVSTTVLAWVDGDGDGRGAGAPRAVCAGELLPAGWSSEGTDCDDGDPGRWAALTLYRDGDFDGVGAGTAEALCGSGAPPPGWAADAGDCAPDDPGRWRELPYSHRDADGDLFTVPSAGLTCAGAELPPGYHATPFLAEDCDDTDPLRFELRTGYLDVDRDGVGTGDLGTFCVGGPAGPGIAWVGNDCAPDDPTRWELLWYGGTDADGDGMSAVVAGEVCAGSSLPAPYQAWPSGDDCDDGDPTRWALLDGYADADRDGVGAGPTLAVCSGSSLPAGFVPVGGDCAEDDPTRWSSHWYTYRDGDGDGRTVLEPGVVCFGLELPPGYSDVRSGNDCDDTNPAIWAWVTAWRDADVDGVGEGAAVSFCTSGAVPEGYVTVGGDCAPGDGTRWRSAPYAGIDRDGDGTTTREAGQVCTGADLPEPYHATVTGNDCDDGDPARYRWVVLYRDLDLDGVGAGPRSIPCVGADLPAGWSIFGFDPDDADSTVQGRNDVSGLLQLAL